MQQQQQQQQQPVRQAGIGVLNFLKNANDVECISTVWQMISEPFHNHTHAQLYIQSALRYLLFIVTQCQHYKRQNLIDMKRQVEEEEETEKKIPTTNNGYNK